MIRIAIDAMGGDFGPEPIIEGVVQALEEKKFLPIQPGDVPATWADVDDLVKDIGYAPRVTIQEGVENFVRWYLDFLNID